MEAPVFSFDCVLPGENPFPGDLQYDAENVECDVITVNAVPENTMKFLGHEISFGEDWTNTAASHRIKCGYSHFFGNKDIYMSTNVSFKRKWQFFRRTIPLSATWMAETWWPTKAALRCIDHFVIDCLARMQKIPRLDGEDWFFVSARGTFQWPDGGCSTMQTIGAAAWS